MEKKVTIFLLLFGFLFLIFLLFFINNNKIQLISDSTELSSNDSVSLSGISSSGAFIASKTYESKINLFENIYNSFNSIKNLSDYKKFDEEFGKSNFMGFLIRLNDEEGWLKLWNFDFDNYIDLKDEFFLEDIKLFGDNLEEQKKGFLSFLSDLFYKIPQKKELSEDEIGIDIMVYFNDLPLNEALKYCNLLRKKYPKKYQSDEHSCEDNIYTYRATKENGYCNMVKDSFKKKLCVDFLEFEGNFKYNK